MNNLNQNIRAHIIEALIKKRFEKQDKAIEAEKVGLGDVYYDLVVPKDVQRKLNKLPAGWVYETSYLHHYCSAANYTHNVPLRFSKPRRLPHSHYVGNWSDADKLALMEFDKVYLDYERRLIEHRKLKDQTRAQLRATLASFRDIDKLVKAWPEIKPFIPKDVPATSVALALPIKSLNDMLGLT